MPTGLKNSQPAGPDPSGLAQQPQPFINRTYRNIIGATGVPQPLNAGFAPVGTSVAVRGISTNAGVVFAGLYREAVQNGQGIIITPDTEISFPVDFGNKIWISGTANDGVILTVRAG